jgi:hypothetical protein
MAVFTERAPTPWDAADDRGTDLVKRVVDAGRLDRSKAACELTGISLSPSVPFPVVRFQFQSTEISISLISLDTSYIDAFGGNNTTFGATGYAAGALLVPSLALGPWSLAPPIC